MDYGDIISTHTSLAGRDQNEPSEKRRNPISTHTSLAGRDPSAGVTGTWDEISTHTSLAGRDYGASTVYSVTEAFLLTRPSRDVTIF